MLALAAVSTMGLQPTEELQSLQCSFLWRRRSYRNSTWQPLTESLYRYWHALIGLKMGCWKNAIMKGFVSKQLNIPSHFYPDHMSCHALNHQGSSWHFRVEIHFLCVFSLPNKLLKKTCHCSYRTKKEALKHTLKGKCWRALRPFDWCAAELHGV